MGGLTGLFLAALGIDVHVTDTYFVVAHFHYIMVGGAVMGYLGGMHFWWPKISGRMYPESLGRLAAVIVFLGFNLTFFPQFILGYLGMPRRYWQYPPEFQVLNVLSTAGSTILASDTFCRWCISCGRCAMEKLPRTSLGRFRPGVDDLFAAAHFQLRPSPVVDWEAYDYEHIPAPQEAAVADSPTAVEHHNPALKHHFVDMEQQREASSLGCGCSRD